MSKKKITGDSVSFPSLEYTKDGRIRYMDGSVAKYVDAETGGQLWGILRKKLGPPPEPCADDLLAEWMDEAFVPLETVLRIAGDAGKLDEVMDAISSHSVRWRINLMIITDIGMPLKAKLTRHVLCDLLGCAPKEYDSLPLWLPKRPNLERAK